jgi:hypothetical protein
MSSIQVVRFHEAGLPAENQTMEPANYRFERFAVLFTGYSCASWSILSPL